MTNPSVQTIYQPLKNSKIDSSQVFLQGSKPNDQKMLPRGQTSNQDHNLERYSLKSTVSQATAVSPNHKQTSSNEGVRILQPNLGSLPIQLQQNDLSHQSNIQSNAPQFTKVSTPTRSPIFYQPLVNTSLQISENFSNPYLPSQTRGGGLLFANP